MKSQKPRNTTADTRRKKPSAKVSDDKRTVALDAERLIECRQKLGWSVAKLAWESGISEDTISRAEKGTRIRVFLAGTIAETLQIPLSKLLDNRRAPFEPSLVVNINALPETGYERLVGRHEKLKRLDTAWDDHNTNILSLVSDGGAGKSALVNEWLKRLQADNYRGADVVLGWSFHSQGSLEREVSAEPFLNWALGKLSITINTTSVTAKGEAIAEALAQRRVLLALDGIEPLQHGLDKQSGELKDMGLRALLRRFASMPPIKTHGLVVLTSRLAVKDIARWKDGSAPVVEMEQLSDEAGAMLLSDNGVWGTDNDLRAAARAFGGHPLALSLLASFLKETQFGDVRRRDHIRDLVEDTENPRYDHVRRVMESYERLWLAGQPEAHAIMHLVGLFDRPASRKCLFAVRRSPAIQGLTDRIVNLDDKKWQRTITRLRDVRLLSPKPKQPSAPDELDAHPLVREWFGQRLRQANDSAWKEAHHRLYHHLCESTREGKAPTLEDLAPLYQAITHGCRAGLHTQALINVFQDRICRRQSLVRLEFYSIHRLGAHGSNLAAISWFFEKPYEAPVVALNVIHQGWVIGQAAFSLRVLGRLGEALSAARAPWQIYEKTKDWDNVSITTGSLAETELLVGEVAAAMLTSEQSVGYADQGRDEFLMLHSRCIQANALHCAGRLEEAQRLFADADQRQNKYEADHPLLYSVPGYTYCELLLAGKQWATARRRARETLEWVRSHSIRDAALDMLTLGRAAFWEALENGVSSQPAVASQDDARAQLGKAVDALRVAGQLEYIPHGLLARAAFRRNIGDWDGAALDLDEVEEIAEPGPMRLHLCDMALERARLIFARIEAFAPLNGLIDDSLPRPEPPRADESAKLTTDARANITKARELIERCGYHRRDEELAELEAVLAGRRRFAHLPPRI